MDDEEEYDDGTTQEKSSGKETGAKVFGKKVGKGNEAKEEKRGRMGSGLRGRETGK